MINAKIITATNTKPSHLASIYRACKALKGSYIMLCCFKNAYELLKLKGKNLLENDL